MSVTIPVFAVNRHRMTVDGEGVTSLVGIKGCPLRCKYCINKDELDTAVATLRTPEELYDILKIDDLYFRATGGGVCFGGGESLLHSEFIEEFHKLTKGEWRIVVETSLNVPKESVERALSCVDEFIVDIKDINNDIYKSYTGQNNEIVLNNLKFLADNKGDKSVRVRVPFINGYNNEDDVNKSVEFIKGLGFEDIDVFEYVIG